MSERTLGGAARVSLFTLYGALQTSEELGDRCNLHKTSNKSWQRLPGSNVSLSSFRLKSRPADKTREHALAQPPIRSYQQPQDNGRTDDIRSLPRRARSWWCLSRKRRWSRSRPRRCSCYQLPQRDLGRSRSRSSSKLSVRTGRTNALVSSFRKFKSGPIQVTRTFVYCRHLCGGSTRPDRHERLACSTTNARSEYRRRRIRGRPEGQQARPETAA